MLPLEPALQFAWAAVGLLCGMTLIWVYQWRHQDAGIVDVGWSAGVGLVAIWLALTTAGADIRSWLVAGLNAVWSLRLAYYIWSDRVRGKPEDGRYQALRERWGSRAQVGFLLFFWAQGVLVLIFALSPWAAMQRPTADQSWLGAWSIWPAWDWAGACWSVWDVLGILVWSAAISGEALADRQLARFRANSANKGQVCRDGLWRYSRHPNYFFEWLHWWSYVLWGVAGGWWWLTLVAPALMLFFLFRVTGIPATEAQALRSRRVAYREYQRTTSAFVPWWPKA
jgi:steroid 5-alpha reductase family enzyme